MVSAEQNVSAKLHFYDGVSVFNKDHIIALFFFFLNPSEFVCVYVFIMVICQFMLQGGGLNR